MNQGVIDLTMEDTDVGDDSETGDNMEEELDYKIEPSAITLPVILTHKCVKINDIPVRIRLHFVGKQRQSVCEFLDGPDAGRFVFSLTAAAARLRGNAASGWTEFLYLGAPLRVGRKTPKFNNNDATFEQFADKPGLPTGDFLAAYKDLPDSEQKGTFKLPAGQTITGLAKRCKSIKRKKYIRNSSRIISSRNANSKRVSRVPSTTTTTTSLPLHPPLPKKIYRLDCEKGKVSNEEGRPVMDSKQNTILDKALLINNLYRQRNRARQNSMLVALSSSLRIEKQQLEKSTFEALPQIPEIREILENANGTLTTESKREICFLAVSHSFRVAVVCHYVNTDSNYENCTFATSNVESDKKIHVAYTKVPIDHYDSVVVIEDNSPSTSTRNSTLEMMALEESLDDIEDASNEVDVEAALPLTLDKAIEQLFERISNNKRASISYMEYQHVVKQIATSNQDVFEEMNAIDIEGTIGKPNREHNLLKMINDKFNKLLSGYYNYRSVARLVHNLTPGESQSIMTAKLALGIVVAKRYLDKKAEKKMHKHLNVLVAGFVQFGKTSNMLILSAILADRGFKYIVILSGKTIVLRNQTANRGVDALKRSKTVEQEDNKLITEEFASFLSEEVYMDVVEISKDHASHDVSKQTLRKLKETKQSISVLVCKKNKDIIKNLNELIHEKCLSQESIALIDDEADDSVNTQEEGKNYTLLHRELCNLYAECVKRAGENFVYFAYTATTAACLIQKSTAMFSPDMLAFMLLNQTSYLGIEHFVSPEFLDIRVTNADGAIELIEEESNAEKLHVVPLTENFQLLRFIIETYGAKEEDLRQITTLNVDSSPNSNWKYDYCRVLKKLLTLRKDDAKLVEAIKEQLELHPASDKRKYQKLWHPETVRASELQYHEINTRDSIQAAPKWLLEFVFRSLLTWVIFSVRISLTCTNNLYSTVKDFIGSQLELSYETYHRHPQIRVLCNNLSGFLDDENFKKVEHCLLSDPQAQQRIFQWSDIEYSKSTLIVNFIAVFFGVNIRVLTDSGVLLYEGPEGRANNRMQHVNITRGKQNYTCSYDYAPVSTPVDDILPHFSAFVHISGRQLAHENVLTILRRILAELRNSAFWDEYAVNNFTHFEPWAAALHRAYERTVDLQIKYAHRERLLNLPTLETQSARPPIPPLDILMPTVRALVSGLDRNNRLLVDTRVRMTRNIMDEEKTTNLTIKDLISSSENKLPLFMFIIGGDCFTRGVTLPNPLTSLFMRYMDNQEGLMQALRWCGHRAPEAIDLMNVTCSSLEKTLFRRLWNNMANNTAALIKHDLQHDGWVNKKQVVLFEEKGNRATYKNKMHYAEIQESRNTRVDVYNPPIRGKACFEVFYAVNTLFDVLFDKYKAECPGNDDSLISKKTKPGILFRNVAVDDVLTILQSIQHDYQSINLDELVYSLKTATQPMSVCFLHKISHMQFNEKQDRYTKKMNKYLRESGKSLKNDLLEYVTPILSRRRENEFLPISIKGLNVLDAIAWVKQKGEKNKQVIKKQFESYMKNSSSEKATMSRSQTAPPLLCIIVLDPEFKTGRDDNKRMTTHKYHSDPAKFCDFPPVGFTLFPQFQSTAVVTPKVKRARIEPVN